MIDHKTLANASSRNTRCTVTHVHVPTVVHPICRREASARALSIAFVSNNTAALRSCIAPRYISCPSPTATSLGITRCMEIRDHKSHRRRLLHGPIPDISDQPILDLLSFKVVNALCTTISYRCKRKESLHWMFHRVAAPMCGTITGDSVNERTMSGTVTDRGWEYADGTEHRDRKWGFSRATITACFPLQGP